MDRRPAGRLHDCDDYDRKEDDRAQQRDRNAARALRLEAQAVQHARAARLYFKVGAPVAFASHFC